MEQNICHRLCASLFIVAKVYKVNGRVEKFLGDSKYIAIQDTLDVLIKQRSRQGMGLMTRQAEVINLHMKNILWDRGLLGVHNSETLLNTII